MGQGGGSPGKFIFFSIRGSIFALGRGTRFWGVSLWASPPPAHVCFPPSFDTFSFDHFPWVYEERSGFDVCTRESGKGGGGYDALLWQEYNAVWGKWGGLFEDVGNPFLARFFFYFFSFLHLPSGEFLSVSGLPTPRNEKMPHLQWKNAPNGVFTT